MRELTLIELEKVSGSSGECLAASIFLGVSPLGGPWTVAGAAFTAYGACVKQNDEPEPDKSGNDYCEDGGDY